MSALEIKAIKKLPDRYVADGTVVLESNDYVVAMNPEYQPIIFDVAVGEWREMKP